MGRIVYVDGRYLPHRHAKVHVEDRGYQFADGVYEVIAVVDGRLVDKKAHLQRLAHSISELRIRWSMSTAALDFVINEVIRRNRLGGFGAVYLQVTRGVAPRNHAFPANTDPVLVITARSLPALDFAAERKGVRVVSVIDERWKRPDIKSISLLANVLAKQHAVEAGAFEAWMVDENGMVTEGAASNAWIITDTGELLTRPADKFILAGITRASLLRLANENSIQFLEKPFSLDEAKRSREAFLTSTTSRVKAVVQIDDVEINNGSIGPLTEQLLDLYAVYVAHTSGY